VLTAQGGVGILSGGLTLDRQERTVRVQSTSLTITLVRDTWVRELWTPALYPLLADALLDAFAVIPQSPSAPTEPAGWAAVVRPALTPAMLTRLDDVTMVLDLPALPAYRLHYGAETVGVDLPSTLLTSSQRVLVQPSLVIERSDAVPVRVDLVKDSWQRYVLT
jgi:hypothetical protein